LVLKCDIKKCNLLLQLLSFVVIKKPSNPFIFLIINFFLLLTVVNSFFGISELARSSVLFTISKITMKVYFEFVPTIRQSLDHGHSRALLSQRPTVAVLVTAIVTCKFNDFIFLR
jgi:hypothetical protein